VYAHTCLVCIYVHECIEHTFMLMHVSVSSTLVTLLQPTVLANWGGLSQLSMYRLTKSMWESGCSHLHSKSLVQTWARGLHFSD